MFFDCWYELLTRVIRIAQRDAQSKDPSRSLDAMEFLADFLDGLEEVGA